MNAAEGAAALADWKGQVSFLFTNFLLVLEIILPDIDLTLSPFIFALPCLLKRGGKKYDCSDESPRRGRRDRSHFD
ncbi:MAG: hypothetical protein ACYC0Q_07720 [Eubacteriales bacterium]